MRIERDPKDAVEEGTRAIEKNPENAVAYQYRGDAYHVLGDYGRAIKDYDKVVELILKWEETYGNIEQLVKNGNMQALLKAPLKHDAYENRGGAYDKLGDYRRAIQDFDKVIQIFPQDAGAYLQRGWAYASLGDDKQAGEDFNKSIQLSPNFAMDYDYENGQLANRKIEIQRNIEFYGKYIALYPKEALAYNDRGGLYLELGDYPLALEDFNKAVGLYPKYVLTYYHRGLVYLKLGDYRRAIEDYNMAIELYPIAI